jgi:hypothetical protein
VRECHPIKFSFDFMKSLNDEKLNFMEARFERQHKKGRHRYASSPPPEKRIERRLRYVIK